MSGNKLPPFPVNDSTLDLLWAALHPNPADGDAARTHVAEFLAMMDQLGGSDPAVVETELDGIAVMRDESYHDHDVMLALITEVRRLRAGIRRVQRIDQAHIMGPPARMPVAAGAALAWVMSRLEDLLA